MMRIMIGQILEFRYQIITVNLLNIQIFIRVTNMQDTLKLIIYGTRGSYPVFGKKYEKYGGSTSCYLIETEENALIVDAGTGITNITDFPKQNIPIFFTHAHVDHIVGLPAFPLLSDGTRNITLYLAKREGLSPKKQVESLVSRPLWPCKISDYPSKVDIKEIKVAEKEIAIGDIKVFTMDGNHPGGSTIFRFEYRDKKVVIATDYEHNNKEINEKLKVFSEKADLILFDAQYTQEEYDGYKGFGHSTPQAGMELKKASGAGELVFIHHFPKHDDSFLDSLAKKFSDNHVHFAYEGEVISI